ncbi:MAG: DUF3526 domain-containing protein [Bacteroidota bacterium]
MWQIIKNEWQYMGRTQLLLSISAGFVLVLLSSILLGNYENAKQAKSSQEAKEHLRAQWESIDAMNPHSAAHYGTYVFKPTNLMSSLDDGVSSVTGNVLRVEGHVQNEMVHSEASQMQAVSRFGKLKSSLLLKYIVPLLLIFLAFSSVSNEKQSGRMKLLIMQGARPFQLILAKTLSVWLVGALLLSLVVVIYSLLNIQSLDGEVFTRTLLFFTSYALYYFIITGLTVYLSARWQNATVALTSMLAVWMLWTVFLPNIFLSSVEKWHPLPSRNEFQAAMKEDRSKGLDGHNPADERKKAIEDRVLAEYGVDSLHQLPINLDGILMQEDEEYGNKVWDKHFGNMRQVFAQQKQSLQLLGLLNPFVSLQNASMGFSSGDNLHHQDFLVQVEDYRRVFIKALNDKHAFGGSKTGDWGWKADNEFYKSVADFDYQPSSVTGLFKNYIPDLGLLLLWTALTFGLLFFGTKKIQL